MTATSQRGTRTIPARTDPRLGGGMQSQAVINVARLERALRKAVRGEVRFDTASKAMYANDASDFRQVPIGVVIPKTPGDVVATHRVCARFGAPILNRGPPVPLRPAGWPPRRPAAPRRRRSLPGRRCRPAPADARNGKGFQS